MHQFFRVNLLWQLHFGYFKIKSIALTEHQLNYIRTVEKKGGDVQ